LIISNFKPLVLNVGKKNMGALVFLQTPKI